MQGQAPMTTRIQPCCLEDTLADVIARMYKSNTHAVPIVDSAGRLLGEIAEEDVRIALKSSGRGSHQILVREARIR